MSTLEEEYNDLLETIKKSNEEVAPKIEALLKEIEDKKKEAMRLAEEAMIAFEFPNSQEMYVSTKIEQKIESIAEKSSKTLSELEQQLGFDLYDIFGFFPTHPIYETFISGHWVPSQYDC